MAGPSQELERPQEGPPDDTPRWCTVESCRRRPFFGPMGGKPMFCQQHSKKSEGMVDVSSRRCEAVGCAKWPLYGNEGQKAKFCSLHKGPSMIDVRSRRCAASGCKRQPSYGFEGKRACFCAAHKAEGMVDVVSRRCEYPNCRRRPLYGFEGKKSQFCSAHKQEGQVDVCNRRCQFPGCSKRPCFGLPGQRPSFCGSHRASEMVDVISHKCGYPGCSHPAGYEANRVRSKFCDKHKSVGLAGASLLQLAISASGDGSSRAPPVPAKGTPPKNGKNPRNSTSEPKAVDKARRDVHSQGKTSGAGEPSSDIRPRRGSFAAPLYSSTPTKAVVTTTKGESAECAPSLPSVGNLLNAPRSHLKRPLEAQEAAEGHCMNVSEAAAALTSSTMDSSTSSSSSHPPNTPPRGVTVGRGGSTEVFKGVHSDTDGEASNRNAMDKDKTSCGASAVAADADTAPALNRSSARAKRLFSGPKRESPEWQTTREEWNPKVGPETGFVTSSPTPDWRKVGLESLGRTASFDEAREAALRQGLDAGNDGRPRRASAFVTHGSSLPPVVTEMGRRCSAVETRAAPIRVPHYSDLLSAKAPFRSVTAYGGGAERYRPTSAGFESQPDNELDDGYSQRAGALPSIQSLTASPRHGAGQVQPLEDSASGLRFSAAVAPAKRMFHVIPAASVYMARSALPSIEQGGASPAGDLLPSRFGLQHERFCRHDGSSPLLRAVAGSDLPRSEVSGDHSKLDPPPCAPYRGQRRFSVLGEGSFAEDGESREIGSARDGVVERKEDSPSAGRSTRRRDSVAPAHDGEEILARSDPSHLRHCFVQGQAWSLADKDASQSESPVRSRGMPYGRDSAREPPVHEEQKGSAGSGARSRGSRPAKILFGGAKKEGDVLTSSVPPCSTMTPAAASSLSSPITKEQASSSPSSRRWSVLERPFSSSSKHLGMPPPPPGYALAWGATLEDGMTVEEAAAEDSIARHGIGARITSESGSARRGPLMPAAFEAMEPPMGPMMSRNPFVAPSVLTPAQERKETLEVARAVQLRRHSFLGVNSRSDGAFLSPHKE